MAVINELIRAEADGTISFGDYTLGEKAKLDNFAHDGGSYKVKTYKDITKLECNDVFVYESVPGTAVSNFAKEEGKVSFVVEGAEDAQITLELEAESEYEVTINGESTGTAKTNLGGKLSFSVNLETEATVVIEKK
ncbi:MAG: endosialidase [Lachnospiraceae bacterium]|nr:endosialidase [Lachnospiraceae bacterium]MBO5097214.1 endosialidase [Agathobacter sp.]